MAFPNALRLVKSAGFFFLLAVVGCRERIPDVIEDVYVCSNGTIPYMDAILGSEYQLKELKTYSGPEMEG